MREHTSWKLVVPITAFVLAFLQADESLAQATDVECNPVGCVDSDDIADGSITSIDIAPGSINATVIANSTIGANKLVPGSINATTIANSSIGANKLIPGSINATVIANQSIGPNKLIPGSINTTTIANGAVTGNKIAAAAVNSDKILDGSIAMSDMGQSVIDAINAGNAEGKVFAHTYVVQSGTLASENCNNLSSTLSAISGAANSYNLVYIEPGRYECASALTIPADTSLIGGGRGITNIVGSDTTVLFLSDNTELRGLSVSVEADVAGAVVRTSSASSVILDKVVIAAFGALAQTAVQVTDAATSLLVSNATVYVANGNALVSLSGNGSIDVFASMVVADAGGSGIVAAANDVVIVNSSEIYGPSALIQAAGATARCFGSWNSLTLNPLNPTTCNI